MTRLPALTSRKMVAALKKGGFVDHHQKGSHLHLWHEERKLMVSVPIHNRDLKRPTMKGIIHQAGLTETEFRKFL